MTLVYRSIFSDTDSAITPQIDDLFAGWLTTKQLSIPPQGLSARGEALSSPTADIAWAQRREIVTGSTDVVRRLRLVEEVPDARWITTVVWSESTDATTDPRRSNWVWVDLEHEPSGDKPLRRPGSPRLVREMLAAGEAQDGPLPLTAEPWSIASSHVEELVGYVLSPARQVPIIVFAHDGQRAYDQECLAQMLARDLAGVAAVYRLDGPATTQRFASSMPEDYAVYGGAMRTYLPGAGGAEDTASAHRLLGRASLTALGPRAFPAVKDQILQLSTARAAPLSAQRPVARKRRWSQPALFEPAHGGASFGPDWVRSRLNKLLDRLNLTKISARESSTEELDRAFTIVLDRLAPSDATPTGDAPAAGTISDSAQPVQGPSRDEVELLEQLLEDADRDIKSTQEQLRLSRREVEDFQLEAMEAVEQADRTGRRLRWLERRLRLVGDSGATQEDQLPPAPTSVAEAVELARMHFAHVHLCEVEEKAAELDLHGASQLYAAKTWAALMALDGFAAATAEGRFSGSFLLWCQTPPEGEPALSANAVAMTESEQVQQNPQWRAARVFRVPTDLHEAGELFMPAHIRIVKRGSPAPRLHFADIASGSGKVIVGYIGEHLPTARFH